VRSRLRMEVSRARRLPKWRNPGLKIQKAQIVLISRENPSQSRTWKEVVQDNPARLPRQQAAAPRGQCADQGPLQLGLHHRRTRPQQGPLVRPDQDHARPADAGEQVAVSDVAHPEHHCEGRHCRGGRCLRRHDRSGGDMGSARYDCVGNHRCHSKRSCRSPGAA
jgi:hypothetical protein